MKPWRPLDEMEHDELRRYSQELLRRWSISPFEDQGELQAYMTETAARMEKLGAGALEGIPNDRCAE